MAAEALMNSTDDARATLEKHAEILRALIRQENDVTNHRTTWLLVSQGILFAAASAFLDTYFIAAVLVGVVGMLTAVSIGHSLKNSYQSRQYLKRTWRQRLKDHGYEWADFPPLDGGNPEVRTINWLFPWTFIPRVFVVAWILLIAYFIWTSI